MTCGELSELLKSVPEEIEVRLEGHEGKASANITLVHLCTFDEGCECLILRGGDQ